MLRYGFHNENRLLIVSIQKLAKETKKSTDAILNGKFSICDARA